jgi:hypothetical protein
MPRWIGGTVVARRAQKSPPGQGGWQIFHTYWYGVDCVDPTKPPTYKTRLVEPRSYSTKIAISFAETSGVHKCASGISRPTLACPSPPPIARMGELLPSRHRLKSVPDDRQLHRCAVAPVVAHQAQNQATQGRDLSSLAPPRALYVRPTTTASHSDLYEDAAVKGYFGGV